MGFGWSTAQGRRGSKRDRGYPSETEAIANARTSYIRKATQLAHEDEEIVWSRKRGGTAVAYETASGRKVWRLYDTNIVEVEGNRVTLNTGGWRTITTRAHMMEAVKEFTGVGLGIHGDQGETLVNFPGQDREAIRFEPTVTFTLEATP